MQGPRRASTRRTATTGVGTSAELRCPEELEEPLLEALARLGVVVVGAGASRPADVVVCAVAPSEAAVALGQVRPPSRTLVLVDDPGPGDVGDLLAAGAAGVLDLRDDVAAIADGVLSVARGYLVLPSHERRALIQPSVPFDLDAIELTWLRSMAAGQSVAALALDQGCSERAMYRRLRAVYRRLRATGRAHAIEVLARADLLDPR
jgi:DNA-binding NarL/FixJ family response regulator